MKRVICIVMVFAAVCALSGCREKKREAESEAFMSLLSLMGRENTVTFYTSDQEGSNREQTVDRIYGREDAYKLFSAVESYGIALSKRNEGFEVHMLKVRHPSNLENLNVLLRGRIEMLQTADMRSYMGDGYEECISSARIYQKGRYLFLLATADNDRAMEAIGKIF